MPWLRNESRTSSILSCGRANVSSDLAASGIRPLSSPVHPFRSPSPQVKTPAPEHYLRPSSDPSLVQDLLSLSVGIQNLGSVLTDIHTWTFLCFAVTTTPPTAVLESFETPVFGKANKTVNFPRSDMGQSNPSPSSLQRSWALWVAESRHHRICKTVCGHK